MFMFLQCVGEAVVAKGLRGLMGVVPLAQEIYDVTAEAIDRYRQRKRESQLVADVEEVVQAETERIREDAARIAQEVAGSESEDVQQQLEAYLSQVPSVATQSLSRTEDPNGKTVPSSWKLNDPVKLSTVLPKRVPQFRVGACVPSAPSWILEQMLGAGGFGEVWLASHSFLDERLAFKFCLDQDARDRLLRHEGEVVKRVMAASKNVQREHHGIVPLRDAYLGGETPWLAYEYVEGGDLTGLMRQWQSNDAQTRAQYALKFFRQLAIVVGRLHRLPDPIIHRDLKPANVLLRKTEKGYVIRVTDFGISHVNADSTLRQSSVSTPALSLGETFRGSHTPFYASPQQKRGEQPDVRDDVYALGIIAWQMLLGDPSADPPIGKWKRRLSEAGLSEEVLDLLESCWDYSPQERPRDALAIVEQLACLSQKAGSDGSHQLSDQEDQESQPSTPTNELTSTSGPLRPPPEIGQVLNQATTRETKADIQRSPLTRTSGDIGTTALGMKFAFVQAGTFWMSEGDKNAQKQVVIASDFCMGIYPVTQGEWQAIMGENPSHFTQPGRGRRVERFPVETVSWEDVQAFLKMLNEIEKNSKWTYRLPTEAEWEYACRGAVSSKEDCSFDFYFAKPTNDLSPRKAAFNRVECPSEVGSYKPNRLGLYDMHGNVWEWCEDWYATDSLRVVRGGCWNGKDNDCRAGSRFGYSPALRRFYLGFRLVFNCDSEGDV